MFDKLIIKNVKTGKPSYTLTMVLIGFFVINVKLLLSGVQITEKIKFDIFSGTDYAASLAAISGLHIFNKKVVRDTTTPTSSEGSDA